MENKKEKEEKIVDTVSWPDNKFAMETLGNL